MQTINYYLIANRCFGVEGEDLVQAIKEMPGFSPFETDDSSTPTFWIKEASGLPVPSVFHQQYTFECDGVSSVFSSTSNGYFLQMKHDDNSHLHLWSDTQARTIFMEGNFMPQMLRFALWTAYGIMSVNSGKIPIHGSCIVNNERAYLFLGESGTGKSTHTRLWRQYIEGSVLLNDDSPIISVEDDGVFIYGSPWSGKTPCYKQERYPLCGCVRLSQAPFNKIQRQSILNAYAALHPSCPPEFAYDETLYAGISKSLDGILGQVPIYRLACLPDEAAARLSYETISK